ncbi:MAG: CRISPR-associated protein Cas4 [Dehalococcoidia bacterium]|nr:MAG: CRISPR-associated protein Cas4 [Dehalococcoidia bacterium]
MDEVLISAIEHWSYCERQCALIHVEGTFEENVFTIRGAIAHERVHSGEITVEHGVRVARALPIWSDRLGIHGVADLVELRPAGPYPVEHKVGPTGRHAALQLCAQALCLEEMFGQPVPRGALYSHASRRRVEVVFDADLRAATEAAIAAIRAMIEEARLPPAPNDRRCRHCSQRDVCLPSATGEPARLRWLQRELFTIGSDED